MALNTQHSRYFTNIENHSMHEALRITSLAKEFLIYLPKLANVFHSYRLCPKHAEQLFFEQQPN